MTVNKKYNWVHYWLLTYAGLHIVVGLALPALVHTSLLNPYQTELAVAFYDSSELPVTAQPLTLWLLGLFGPTIASWGVLLWCLTQSLLPQYPLRLRNALVCAILVWAPLDSVLGWHAGVNSNAFFNTTAVLLLIPPLLALSRQKS